MAALFLAGCDSTKFIEQDAVVQQTAFRPDRVFVYDFGVMPADVPPDAPVGARVSPGATLSPEQVAVDRKLGADMAAELVTAIKEMGMPAERAGFGAPLQTNVLVIRGCFVSMQESGGARRYTIGLDFHAAELMAAVEGFQVTAQGVGRPIDLGPPVVTAAGPTAPGIIFTSGTKVKDEAEFRKQSESWSRQAVKEIAERLKPKFREQGWIN